MILTSNRGEPNWSDIPTAGKSTKTQKEFVNEIRELAKKAALTTNKAEKEYISKQVLQLRAEYLSDVVPDRKGLYRQAKNLMKNQNHPSKCKGLGELMLLDFLQEAEDKNNHLAEKKFALAIGGILTCPILSSGGYGAVIQYQGANVLTNLGNEWSFRIIWKRSRFLTERLKIPKFEN